MILLRIRIINLFSCDSFHKSESSLIEELRVMVSKFGQYEDQICGGSKIPRLVDEL